MLNNPSAPIKTVNLLIQTVEQIEHCKAKGKAQRRTQVKYSVVDTSDPRAMFAAERSDSRTISPIYYDPINRRQVINVAGKFSPVSEWI